MLANRNPGFHVSSVTSRQRSASSSRQASGRVTHRGCWVPRMLADTTLLVAYPVIAGFIALPAFIALVQRRAMREASEVASALAEFAAGVRCGIDRTGSATPLDGALCARAERLGMPEFASMRLAQDFFESHPLLLADTAQRLALRLKRRIAFERKMLARTASGRRRGAVAAAIAPLVLLSLHAAGFALPLEALGFVLCVEGGGCWLLWRLARVGI
jgi:hypothetical protein